MKKIIILMLCISLIGIASSVGEVSYCCEKTVGGAWCQNSPQANCKTDNSCAGEKCKSVPSSCESTSYCKLGCCYDSQEGTCMENTPQKVCNDNGGVWDGSADCSIPQCELACCLIGDQAAFVTQTRCKKLSALYGLETNFRTDLTSELTCIASAMSDAKGACVYEEDYSKTCQFLTKKECSELSVGNETEFHEGFLCSAETLGTNCGASQKTTCVEGRDEVYFVDTCGNLANIYDSSKVNNKEYWTNIYEKGESCGFGSSNANSVGCGNCDYYLGSTCKDYKIANKKATYGDNICKDLSCKYDGEIYKHGETWCANSNGVDKSLPGSRSFRLVCYNGEVSVEPCADFRQENCIQSDINGFKTAACRVNMWQDCFSQTEKKDCENIDKRDCKWIAGGNKVGNSTIGCVPLNAPGFNFWEEESEAEELCSLATKTCVIKYEKKIIGGEKCVENCECENEEAWKASQNEMCVSFGDCGEKKNYLGFVGY
ncbi:MAG: hypothetical protein ABIA78_00615 [archaeon]